MNSTINKINGLNVLSKQILRNVPIALQVRGHVGYLPAEGLLHPWDTENARLYKQVIHKGNLILPSGSNGYVTAK